MASAGHEERKLCLRGKGAPGGVPGSGGGGRHSFRGRGGRRRAPSAAGAAAAAGAGTGSSGDHGSRKLCLRGGGAPGEGFEGGRGGRHSFRGRGGRCDGGRGCAGSALVDRPSSSGFRFSGSCCFLSWVLKIGNTLKILAKMRFFRVDNSLST